MTREAKAPWKRKVRNCILAILIIVGLPVGAHFYLRWSAAWELRRAVAEADRLDPGWRLRELEERRATLADSENSALKVLDIKKALPRRWTASQRPRLTGVGPRFFQAMEDEVTVHEPQLHGLSPEVQCSGQTIRFMREDLSDVTPVLVEARRLADFPRGRYPVEYAHRLWETDLLSEESQVVAKLLWMDGILAAQDQHIDQALTSALALINAGRSIGDEPILSSQSHRLDIQRQALLLIERALAQGQASADRLEAVQRLLEEEAAEPLLLQAFRAERAGTYGHMTAVLSGRWRFTLRFYHGRLANKIPLSWNRYIDMVIVRRTYPEYLRLLTALVEAAKLPTEEQSTQIEKLIDQSRQMPIEFQSWFESAARWVGGYHRNQAWLRCGIAALAAERFRLARGHWPDSLETLTPDFLTRTPPDPFPLPWGTPPGGEGKEIWSPSPLGGEGLGVRGLHFHRLKDSLVIYSVGPDGIDHEGLINRESFQLGGLNIGFQLWDVSQRRQPWRPTSQTKSETEVDEDQTP